MTRGAVGNRMDPFKVLFFDFPGQGPSSWREEYENLYSGYLPSRCQQFAKVYAHPFLESVESQVDGLVGYRLIIQYWFFYPFNDGGNNHEGDWEDINVVIGRRPCAAVPPTRLRDHVLETLDRVDWSGPENQADCSR